MKRRYGLLILLLLILLIYGGCDKKNPTAPQIINSINRIYSSVHLVGDFNNWGISDPVNNMVFRGDHVWDKNLVLSTGDYEFKFATGYSWDNDNFGDNDTPDIGTDPNIISGTAEKGGGNITLSVSEPGEYKFTFNDQTLEYSIDNSAYFPDITNYTISSISSAETFTFICQATDADGAVAWVKIHYWDNAGGTNLEQIETLTNTTGNTFVIG